MSTHLPFLLVILLFSALTAPGENPLIAGLPHPDGPARTAVLDDGPATFEARRDALIDEAAANEPRGVYDALLWMAAGKQPPAEAYSRDLRRIAERQDCADFGLHGILRVLYQFCGNPNLEQGVHDALREAVLGFKYWPDEPGIDSMCSWSENHYILFAAGGYLAGQRYPEELFSNTGNTGREMMARFRPRVEKWLELRFKTGFSEWLSAVYYEEDLLALVNLVDFCEDQALATRAAMVIDLLLADVACNSFHGLLSSTQGRSYDSQKKWPVSTSVSRIARLAFGRGSPGGGMGATQIALSTRYRVPAVLAAIANDVEATVTNRQRVGIRMEEGARWGLGYGDVESGMHWLTLEAYTHPRTINLFMKMLNEFNWWENAFFAPLQEMREPLSFARRTGVLPLVSYTFKRDITRNQRSEANLFTFRTPDYQLSTAQDWRPGFGGDQQHTWQATLGPAAVCFTTHPSKWLGRTPGRWAGNGTHPRAAQVENVVLCLYDIRTRPGLYVTNHLEYTHAWLPVDGFDETVERAPWLFARKGDGYLALYSQHPWRWQDDPKSGEDFMRELIVEGKQNIYVCELGRAAEDGPFEAFMARIEAAALETDGLHIRYESPSQGLLEFAWEGPLTQRGIAIPLRDYPRYGNPYAQADFPGDTIRFAHGDDGLELNWPAATRTTAPE
jgi:hypothetical protein